MWGWFKKTLTFFLFLNIFPITFMIVSWGEKSYNVGLAENQLGNLWDRADEAEKPNSSDGTKIYIGVECVPVNEQRTHSRIHLEFLEFSLSRLKS